MTGFHTRVGDRRKRDAAISIQQILAVQELLEEDWEEVTAARDVNECRSVAEIGSFYLLGYCCSLRGFELPKILLTELK